MGSEDIQENMISDDCLVNKGIVKSKWFSAFTNKH